MRSLVSEIPSVRARSTRRMWGICVEVYSVYIPPNGAGTAHAPRGSMADGMSRVRARRGTPSGAQRRLRAVGQAYLDFARTEPGLFDTAFAATEHHPPAAGNAKLGPLDHLKTALDELVEAGLLEPARRSNVEYPTWATVHGLAVLLRGPLGSLSDREKMHLEAQTLAFIAASLS